MGANKSAVLPNSDNYEPQQWPAWQAALKVQQWHLPLRVNQQLPKGAQVPLSRWEIMPVTTNLRNNTWLGRSWALEKKAVAAKPV